MASAAGRFPAVLLYAPNQDLIVVMERFVAIERARHSQNWGGCFRRRDQTIDPRIRICTGFKRFGHGLGSMAKEVRKRGLGVESHGRCPA